MKKCVCILLAIQILATSSPTGQAMHFMFKLGAFAQHYIHHLTAHREGISLAEFVTLHYSDHDHHEQDHTEHSNLPFQHHHHDQQHLSPQAPFSLPPQPVEWGFFQTDCFSNPPIAHAQQRLFSLHLSDIWQPPKA